MDKKKCRFLTFAINYTDYQVNSRPDTDSYKFFQKTRDLFFIQNIHEASRVREGNRPSTLDYVFTDEENLLDGIQYEVPLGKSNHCLPYMGYDNKQQHIPTAGQ